MSDGRGDRRGSRDAAGRQSRATCVFLTQTDASIGKTCNSGLARGVL